MTTSSFLTPPIEHVEMIARDLARHHSDPFTIAPFSSAANDLCFVSHLWGNQLLGLIKFRRLGRFQPQIAFFQPFVIFFGETKKGRDIHYPTAI
jgi:hypothetical protein